MSVERRLTDDGLLMLTPDNMYHLFEKPSHASDLRTFLSILGCLEEGCNGHRRRFVLCVLLIFCMLPLGGFAFADERDRIIETRSFAQDAQISVAQPVVYDRSGRFELRPAIGVIPSDDLVTYLPLSLSLAYYINMDWKVDVTASFMGCFSENIGDHQSRLASEHCLRFGSRALDRLMADGSGIDHVVLETQPVMRTYVRVSYYPIYGKIAWLNRGLSTFSLAFDIGAGMLLRERVDQQTLSSLSYFARFEAMLGADFSILFTPHVGLSLQYNQFISMNPDNDGVSAMSEIELGFVWLI